MKTEELTLDKINKLTPNELTLFLKDPENLKKAISLVNHLFTEPVWQDDSWCMSMRDEDETPLKYKLEDIPEYSIKGIKIPLQENRIGWLNYGNSNETVIKFIRNSLPEDNHVIVEKSGGKYMLKIVTKMSDCLNERALKQKLSNKFSNIVVL